MSEYDVYFNDINIAEYGLKMRRNHEHPVSPPLRNRALSIPGKHGAYDYGSDRDPIPFILPLTVKSNGATDLQNKLREVTEVLFKSDGRPNTFKLVFGYESDRYYNVKVTSDITPSRILGFRGDYDLELTCYDGFARSALENIEVNWGSTSITFENETYTYGHTGAGTDEEEITGNEKTFNITVAGGNVRPRITLTGTGDNVSVTWDFKTFHVGNVDGQVIIDLENYVVIDNNALALDKITGDWLHMFLSPGETEVTVTGTNMDMTAVVSFNDVFY